MGFNTQYNVTGSSVRNIKQRLQSFVLLCCLSPAKLVLRLTEGDSHQALHIGYFSPGWDSLVAVLPAPLSLEPGANGSETSIVVLIKVPLSLAGLDFCLQNLFLLGFLSPVKPSSTFMDKNRHQFLWAIFCLVLQAEDWVVSQNALIGQLPVAGN